LLDIHFQRGLVFSFVEHIAYSNPDRIHRVFSYFGPKKYAATSRLLPAKVAKMRGIEIDVSGSFANLLTFRAGALVLFSLLDKKTTNLYFERAMRKPSGKEPNALLRTHKTITH